MANKVKKISANALEKAIKANYTPSTTVEWNGLEITVKKKLTLAEMYAFVDSVILTCFAKNDGTFIPENKTFAIRSVAITLYSNIRLPSNEEKIYDIIYGNGLWEIIENNIDKDQYIDMIKAINEKIKFLSFSNAEAMNQQARDLYSTVEEVTERISSLFEGVDPDDVKSIASAVANGGFDEAKLMQAYLENKEDKDATLSIVEASE